MRSRPEKIIFRDHETLSLAAADLFIEAAENAIRKRGRFVVALSGGSTPKRFFELLGNSLLKNRISREKIFFFWSDERIVPHTSEESNYYLANVSFLKKIKIPRKNIFAVPVKGEPDLLAKKYEFTIREFFGNERVAFDWTMLGVGTDGHTASLFPGSEAIHEKRKLVIASYASASMQWRISFSIPLINKSRRIVLLVSGKEKATVVSKVFSLNNAMKLPVEFIDPAKSLWLLDKAAAAR
jgi:6-phosphogluconolactonase